MNILFAASEAVPYMATGGLADVAGALPKSLCKEGHDCRVIMPLYDDIDPTLREGMEFIGKLIVPLAWRQQYCGVFMSKHEGVTYYFVDNEYYFKRVGIYGFFDDAERFAYFSRAVLQVLENIDFTPDIIHANDWQCSLIPVYLKVFYKDSEKLKNVRTVFTIHNIQFQGKYGLEIMGDVLGLPPSAAVAVEFEGCVNMMKGAIVACDRLTTVSPTYAGEITDPWYSFGLDPVISANSHKLFGVLNGIDTDMYNPKTDAWLYENYTMTTIKKKLINKERLCERLEIPYSEEIPLVGIVTRLTSQKGLDLVVYALNDIIAKGMQVVILGSGDYKYERFFNEMQSKYPDKVSFNYGFIPELARKIYSSADIFLMPSKTEPCGLAQMVALRYGTIPIVRETGGLKDSIIDAGTEGGYGYTFKTYNAHDMLGAIDRANNDFHDKKRWNAIVKTAMKCDFSWEASAKKYIEMYSDIV